MAFTTNKEAEKPATDSHINYEVKVLSAKIINEKRVLFTANVNGIKIDGFALVEYTNQKEETNYLVQYPSRKGLKDGKEAYFNTVWFPISKELRKNIVEQIFSLIG